MGKSTFLFILCFTVSLNISHAWIHQLKLVNDVRRHIAFTTSYGFLRGGTLDVNVTLFSFPSDQTINQTDVFGFSLDKSRSSSVLTTMTNSPVCNWDEPSKSVQSVNFRFDLRNQRMLIHRLGEEVQNLTITATGRRQYLAQHGLAHGDLIFGDMPKSPPRSAASTMATKPTEVMATRPTEVMATKPTEVMATKPTEVTTKSSRRRKRAAPSSATPTLKQEVVESLPLVREMTAGGYIFKTHFLVHIKTEPEEGLYSLFFHNCLPNPYASPINLSLDIVQENNGNFLSADEMPMPAIYFILSMVYVILTLSWGSVLRKAEEGVYKLHYLMLVVVFFKGLSCLFHGVNLFMIGRTGIHLDAWAILWYIVYLMRGALMFLTILLIGTGWVFIKHVFTDRERKLFLVVIPLQILDNVAWVIMEESEEGNSTYDTWHKIFIGFDLVCCFTILFPVIWSIRHLQEASKTDGKAAMNLVKLKLFRHYYFLVVCYIYFTRIIKYFLEITLPFHYGWLEVVLTETFLLVFYILIGYKFRPMCDNPYLQVPTEDEEEMQMDEVVTRTGATEHLIRVNKGRGDGEEELDTSAVVIKQRESSHEYD